MKPGRIAAWAIAAVAVPGLAACSGTSSGSSPTSSASSSAAGTSSPAQSQAGSQPANNQQAGQGQAARSGRLTLPGAHLAFGGPATVGWVPPSQDTGAGAHHGIKLRVTVVSIQKGTMADFRNVELNGNERTSTPYYVQLRVTALSSTPPPASPATPLAEIPAAAPAGRDRRGPGGRCAGAALRVRAVEAVFLCRRA
jgi:hypothetical protein